MRVRRAPSESYFRFLRTGCCSCVACASDDVVVVVAAALTMFSPRKGRQTVLLSEILETCGLKFQRFAPKMSARFFVEDFFLFLLRKKREHDHTCEKWKCPQRSHALHHVVSAAPITARPAKSDAENVGVDGPSPSVQYESKCKSRRRGARVDSAVRQAQEHTPSSVRARFGQGGFVRFL